MDKYKVMLCIHAYDLPLLYNFFMHTYDTTIQYVDIRCLKRRVCKDRVCVHVG